MGHYAGVPVKRWNSQPASQCSQAATPWLKQQIVNPQP